jgi:hypothetical protein
MLLKGDEGVQEFGRGVALRVTGTVPLHLNDPSAQLIRVVAQQEPERLKEFGARAPGSASPHAAGARTMQTVERWGPLLLVTLSSSKFLHPLIAFRQHP